MEEYIKLLNFLLDNVPFLWYVVNVFKFFELNIMKTVLFAIFLTVIIRFMDKWFGVYGVMTALALLGAFILYFGWWLPKKHQKILEQNRV